jgi:hypothetical protein
MYTHTGIHMPPGATCEINASNLDNYLIYKGEMIFSLINTLRLYLYWRVAADVMRGCTHPHCRAPEIGHTVCAMHFCEACA